MIATLAPRFTKLPPAQRRLWPRLRPSVPLEFVLYGGTAISLHLGHRRSVDFDFFHDRPLDLTALRSAFGFLDTARTLQQTKDTLVVVAAGVKVSFFGGLRFGRVGDPLLTRDGMAEVASLDDLMAHTLKVILQRAEKKDYEDITAMLRAGVSLAQGLAAARLLFGPAFQPTESLTVARVIPAKSSRSAPSLSAGSGSTSTMITAGDCCPWNRRMLEKVSCPGVVS